MDYSNSYSHDSNEQLLKQSRLQIAHLVQFLFGSHNPLVKHRKNVNNRILFIN